MTDYSHLLKNANEISEEILQKYNKHRNQEDNDALSAFSDKNVKVGSVNGLIDKTERKYFDKWYENSLSQVIANYNFLPYTIYEFNGVKVQIFFLNISSTIGEVIKLWYSIDPLIVCPVGPKATPFCSDIFQTPDSV